jgi:hypothetical protein
MGTRSVRLDPETDALLDAIATATGESVSDVLKQGIAELAKARGGGLSTRPYDVFRSIELRSSASSEPASRHKHAVRRTIARKLSRA